jgi:hypothetical protein
MFHQPSSGAPIIVSVTAQLVGSMLAKGDKILVPDSQPIDNAQTEIHVADAQKQGDPHGGGPFNAADIYVRSLYEERLGRDASNGELDAWEKILSIAGRRNVALGIDASAEARIREVDSWYSAFLNRQAQNGEEQGWVNQLLQGTKESDVLAQILASPEFGSNMSDQKFVQTLYQDLLNRGAGSTEVQGWMTVIQAGGRAAAAGGILDSSEFRAAAVATFYVDVLGRPPDPAGIASWVNSNMTLPQLRAAFDASDEAFNASQIPGGTALLAAEFGSIPAVTSPTIGSAAGTEPSGGPSPVDVPSRVFMSHQTTSGLVVVSVASQNVGSHLQNGDKIIIPNSAPVDNSQTEIHVSDVQSQGDPHAGGAFNSDNIFIRTLYEEKLGRDASNAEMDSWQGVLSASGTAGVALGIEGTAEARTKLVDSWYGGFLHRQPQGGEEQGYVNELLQGASEASVLGQIFSSGEFSGSMTDQNYIQTLYTDLLGRGASDGEVSQWMGVIQAAGRAGVATGILGSLEFRVDAVNTYFVDLLGRPADDAGLASYVNSNLTLPQLRATFDASPEAFNASQLQAGG